MAVPVLCPGLARFIAGYPYAPHSNRRSWLREFHRFRHRKVGKLFFVTFRPYKIACFLPTEVCLSIRVCVGQLWRRRSLALAHTRTNALSLSPSLRRYYTRTRCTNAACKWRSRLNFIFATPSARRFSPRWHCESSPLGAAGNWGPLGHRHCPFLFIISCFFCPRRAASVHVCYRLLLSGFRQFCLALWDFV